MPLPHILLSLMPWKPRPLRSLEFSALKLSPWAYYFAIADRSVVSLFYHFLSSPATSALSCFQTPSQVSAWHTRSTINPLMIKLPKSRITVYLHSFIPLFSHLWNQLSHSLQSHSSLQVFKTAVYHHLRCSPFEIHDLCYSR